MTPRTSLQPFDSKSIRRQEDVDRQTYVVTYVVVFIGCQPEVSAMAHNKTLAGAAPLDEEALLPAGKCLLNDDQHGMAPNGSAKNRTCPCAQTV
jgi:hypothetical protein